MISGPGWNSAGVPAASEDDKCGERNGEQRPGRGLGDDHEGKAAVVEVSTASTADVVWVARTKIADVRGIEDKGGINQGIAETVVSNAAPIDGTTGEIPQTAHAERTVERKRSYQCECVAGVEGKKRAICQCQVAADGSVAANDSTSLHGNSTRCRRAAVDEQRARADGRIASVGVGVRECERAGADLGEAAGGCAGDHAAQGQIPVSADFRGGLVEENADVSTGIGRVGGVVVDEPAGGCLQGDGLAAHVEPVEVERGTGVDEAPRGRAQRIGMGHDQCRSGSQNRLARIGVVSAQSKNAVVDRPHGMSRATDLAANLDLCAGSTRREQPICAKFTHIAGPLRFGCPGVEQICVAVVHGLFAADAIPVEVDVGSVVESDRGARTQRVLMVEQKFATTAGVAVDHDILGKCVIAAERYGFELVSHAERHGGAAIVHQLRIDRHRINVRCVGGNVDGVRIQLSAGEDKIKIPIAGRVLNDCVDFLRSADGDGKGAGGCGYKRTIAAEIGVISLQSRPGGEGRSVGGPGIIRAPGSVAVLDA